MPCDQGPAELIVSRKYFGNDPMFELLDLRFLLKLLWWLYQSENCDQHIYQQEGWLSMVSILCDLQTYTVVLERGVLLCQQSSGPGELPQWDKYDSKVETGHRSLLVCPITTLTPFLNWSVLDCLMLRKITYRRYRVNKCNVRIREVNFRIIMILVFHHGLS